MDRHVKGVLFVDYVRMIRGNKNVDWSRHLDRDDIALVHARIEPDGWYPMSTFERMGNAILREVADGSVSAVRMWGRLSAAPLHASQPLLVADGDPVETVNRFRVLRSTYFDFEALDVISLIDGHSEVTINYFMGDSAEQAASFQTMGFFEGILEAAGARDIDARFVERAWEGNAATRLELRWRTPRTSLPPRLSQTPR